MKVGRGVEKNWFKGKRERAALAKKAAEKNQEKNNLLRRKKESAKKWGGFIKTLEKRKERE